MAKIFDIEIKNAKKADVYNEIERKLLESSGDVMFIATLNPEIVLLAREDHEYKKVLQSTYSIVDGVGLKLVLMAKNRENFTRMTGVELCEFILERAHLQKMKVLIVMRRGGFSSKREVDNYLSMKYTNNLFKVLYEDELSSLKEKDQYDDYEILLVSIGAPGQEKLIKNQIKNFPQTKIAMGVGGTFDYWTGKKRRAPRIFQQIGIEWLWRLCLQPNRARRIVNAIILFPFFALIEKND